jgi:hypothetical protein
MKEFRDDKDRTWQLSVNCDTVEAVKADCGCNLIDLADPDSDLLREVTLFPPLIAKLLFAMLGEQAKVKGVDDREFRKSMGGDALDEAKEALFEELINFCPKRQRPFLKAVLDKNREVQEAGISLALARLNDPELVKQSVAALDQRVRSEMESALARLAPRGEESPMANGSSTNAGPSRDSSTGPSPGLTPGDGSNASLTAPGDPLAT